MCAGQVVDAPPAHLQEEEADDEQGKGHLLPTVGQETVVDVPQVGEPSDGGPCLLRVPRPIVPPCLLGPQRPEKHAEGHEGQSHIDQVVGDIHLLVGGCRLFEEEQVGRHDGGRSKQRIGEHIDDDVRCEPRALQCRHERLGMDFRFEQVDTDEDDGEQRAEREDPLVAPSRVDEQSGQRQEEGVPKSRLPHGSERRPLDFNPEEQYEGEEDYQSGGCCGYGPCLFVAPCLYGPYYPKQCGRYSEIDKVMPGHFLRCAKINIDRAPSSIIPMPV